MNTVTVSLGTLVNKALYELQGPQEQGRRVVMGSTVLSSPTATTFTLTDPAAGLAVSDLIEFGSELVLVTDASGDVVPVYTCARGYYGSTAGTHTENAVGVVNPAFPRVRVAEAVKRAFARLEALGLPLVKSDTFRRTSGLTYVEMPSDCREVMRVGYFAPDGKFWELPMWRFHDDIPVGKIPSGKIVRLGRFVADVDDLEIVYRTPYRWSSFPAEPTEASTIQVTEGAEDLPAMYASAWLTISREVSRADIDRVPEWQAGEPVRGGVSLSLVKLKWQDFYRSLDETKRLYVPPIHRPYVKMPRFN